MNVKLTVPFGGRAALGDFSNVHWGISFPGEGRFGGGGGREDGLADCEYLRTTRCIKMRRKYSSRSVDSLISVNIDSHVFQFIVCLFKCFA